MPKIKEVTERKDKVPVNFVAPMDMAKWIKEGAAEFKMTDSAFLRTALEFLMTQDVQELKIRMQKKSLENMLEEANRAAEEANRKKEELESQLEALSA